MGKISFVLIIICTVLFSCQKEIKHEIPVLKINYEGTPDPSKVEDMQNHMQVRFQPLETQDSAYFRLKSSVVMIYKDKIFVNDIDGLGTFFMEQLEGNKLVGLLMPEELLDYMETHKDVKLSPTGKKVLENLQYDDNPIVVIATLI